MAMNDIVKLALDVCHGTPEKFSMDEAQETLHKAIVDLNNGKTSLDFRSVQTGGCNELFAFIETVLTRTTEEGLQANAYFNALVDYRNVAQGDQNVFEVEDSDLFVVSKAASGTQGLRRQRIGGTTKVTLPTTFKGVKIYEELDRILAGKVDFGRLIQKVGESYQKAKLQEIYDVWTAATVNDFGGSVYFPTAGAYSETALLDVIAHVEAAANGKTAKIVGTKKALRKLMPSIIGVEAKSDLYNMGYMGKFYGSDVIAVANPHKVNSTQFALSDNVIHIIAGDDKPIKYVTEGNGLIIVGNPLDNADLTQEYLFGEKTACGIVLAGGNAGIGRYEMTP